MHKIILFLIIGAIFAFTMAQEIQMYHRGPPPLGADSDGEVQDEGELASALGVDRQALYEDLMRIQQELGGAPMGAPLTPLGGMPSDQSSQESDY